ncbi:cytochrome P450 [Xylariaceae sp. AK1471]|nr:cytochrome P450 [Xylariaceae sp. AK1471]
MLDDLTLLALGIGAGVLGTIYALFYYQVRPVTEDDLRDIPVLQFEGSNAPERYLRDTRTLLKVGYEKYLRHGTPFQMRNPIGEMGPQVFLPMKYLDEVKRAPKTLFSFDVFSEKAYLLSYSHGPRQTDAAVLVIKDDLNKNLGNMVTGLWAETAACLNETVPPEWQTVPAYLFLCGVVARTVSYALVGPTLCRNPQWQRIVIEATYAVFGAAHAIRQQYTPRWRWLARWKNSTQSQLKQIRIQAAELLKPIYNERREAVEHTSRSRTSSTPFQDTVYWLLGRKPTDKSLAGIVDQELFLSMASIHTTSGSLNSFLFDWLAHPEYHEDIKAEVKETLAKVQSSDGKWTLQHVAMMKKLDSFIKESSRVNPIGFITGQRYTLKPYTFKDGLHIPAGTTILFDADGIHHDPDNYPDPDKFDGYRFLHLRETVDANRFHYASVSDTSLNFGAGQHACPGRFFNALVVKFVLILLMTRYDVTLEDGSTQRPPEDFHDNNMRPDTSVKIRIRKLD